MARLVRYFRDHRRLWYLWVPSTLAIAASVPLVLAMPLVQKTLIDEVLLAGRFDLLLATVGLYSLMWLGAAAVNTAGSVTRAYLDERLALQFRLDLFARCEALSVPLWHRQHSGRTMSLFGSDAPRLVSLVGSGLVLSVGQLLMLVASAVVMFHLSWELAVIVVSVPALVAGAGALIARPLRRASRQAQDKTAELSERVHESLGGLREVAAFDQVHVQAGHLATTLHELVRLRMRLATMGAAIGAGQSAFSLVVTIVILGAGGYLVLSGQTTLGTLIAFQGLFSHVYQTGSSLVGMVISAQTALASADRLYEFLDLEPLVQERPDARDPVLAKGVVGFEHVHFGYAPDQPVLKDVSFTARLGEVIALVGPSGAGKTTLVGLISRFYDPDTGRVTLDGVDLRDLTLAGLRRNIGVVFQDPFLFATTIRENIAFGRPGADEAAIVAAARAANAWEFIETLPDGLDTQVGPRGARISEGQKQRLAIARALLRDPRILILDEPTSALDARSERLLQGALDNLMRGRTTFVIAHRLATVRRADRILVLDSGRIVEQGTHDELIANRGLYHDLYELQFNARPWGAAGTNGHAMPALTGAPLGGRPGAHL